MGSSHLFEVIIMMVAAIIVFHFLAQKLKLPPAVALLGGGALLAFTPGLPSISVNPDLVLVIFLPPLLLDGAWSIPLARLRRHKIGIASLAVGAVLFTSVVVAVVVHWCVPTLPWATCAVLGAIVSPPDAISARAVLERVKLPRRLQILLEGESLLNDASGLVLFRFAVAAGVTGTFSMTDAVLSFFTLAAGGAVIGAAVGFAWVRYVRRLGDEHLIIAATVLLCWASYLLAELVHVSGVIATVVTGLVASWNQHTVLSASIRMRGSSFWGVMIFLMEAGVFILIGLSLQGVVARGGGIEAMITSMGVPILATLAALTVARIIWVFASEGILAVAHRLGLTSLPPLGFGCATVLSWAGMRGVVTLALALSIPEGFPGRDLILVVSFAVILGTVVIQGTTLGLVIDWAKLSEPETERPPLTMSMAEAAMAQAQLETVKGLAYDDGGELIHPRLLQQYERKAVMTVSYAERTEYYEPMLHAHFDIVLEAIARGRQELIRLHREGKIDNEILDELERDLDLEELKALSAKS